MKKMTRGFHITCNQIILQKIWLKYALGLGETNMSINELDHDGDFQEIILLLKDIGLIK